MFTVDILPTLITVVFISILSVTVLLSNKKNITNILYAVFSSFGVFWLIVSFMFDHSTEMSSASLLLKASNLSGVWFVYSLVLFAVVFTGLYRNEIAKRIIIAIGVVPLLLSVLMLSPYSFSELAKVNGYFIPSNNSFVYTLMAYYVTSVISVALVLYKKLKRSSQSEKNKIRYVLIGLFLSASTALFPSIFASQIGMPQLMVLSPLCLLFFIGATSYGILKGGLFDVRMAIVRSVTYSLLIATLAGIYAGSTFAISSVFSFGQSTPAQIVANIAISLILVFLFQPLRRFFDRITNRIFYKDNYNSDEFFGRLNKTLAVTTDLRELLKRASKEIGTTLKSSQAFFYIYTSDSEHHIAAGTSNHTDLNVGVAEDIKQYAINKPGVIVATILDDDNEIKQVLSTHKIEIVLPLIQDKTIIGFLCLGENMGSNYTDRDVSVLNTVSNGLIIAIQNALAVQEIRDFNVTLRQRIAEATQELRVKNAMLKKLDKAKDEFVSMASHQLRTPLTSVKGYLSMVVEGDAGKVTPQQKELLNEAYSSNERMVNLVNDFLNVSRIQTGKFMLEKLPVDLAKLVDEEVKGLVQNATKRQITLDYKAPVDVPQLNIDEGKIRQVVMNYIDNAIYYSNTDSTIKIDLSIDGDDVVFTVKDTGIGVPVSEQSGLFTKFYRASNAKKQRPDGTGVGLYLAKKIITAHDGKIVFSTVEGRGSTFGFRLPIKELALSTAKQLNDLKD